MSMLPPQYPASRRSTAGPDGTPAATPRRRSLGGPALSTPTRRVSMASSTPGSTPAGSGSAGVSPYTANTLMQTPGSLASSSTISHRRRSMHRRTPKANEPLARIVSAASTVGLLARTPEEISASYEQWMKLAADNKINASNSWHLGLIDYFADMRILKEGDGGINFQKASCTLDGCVKIYSTRVDAVASETEVLVSGLNDAKQAAAHAAAGADGEHDGDEDDENSEAAKAKAAERRAKRAARKANMRTLEKDFAPITTAAIDVEFMIDPLFRKTCAEFDEGGADSLLLSRLAVGGKGQIIFDSSGIVENAGTAASAQAAEGSQENAAEPVVKGVDLTRFASLANIVHTDLTTKSMCPTLATFVLSDEMRGVESLTQVLELDLLDELSSQIPPAATFSQSYDQTHDDHHRQMDMTSSFDDNNGDTYVPLTLAPAMPASADDFYSEANLFADEFDDDDHDAFEDAMMPAGDFAASAPGAGALLVPVPVPATAADIGDDQFLLLPLPRSRGVLASAAAAAAATPVSTRLAMLRAARSAGTGATPARTRKPPAMIDFFTTPNLRYEDVMVKGGSGINLARATLGDGGAAAGMAETTSMDLHIAANPFDEGSLARSSLKPRGVFPRGLAREVRERGGVARMVEVLGGVEEDEGKVERRDSDEDDGADVGAGADWDVEAPVLDDGEVPAPPAPATQMQFGEDDMDMDMDMDGDGGIGFVEGPSVGHAAGRVLDPIVAADLEMRGMDADVDMPPPAFDLTIDAEALGGGSNGFYGASATLGVPRPGTGAGGPQLISAFTQHIAGTAGTLPSASSQFRRNRMALNFAKRSKRVDVKKLKENIWRTIRRGAEVVDVVADPDAPASDENKEVGGEDKSGSGSGAAASDALAKAANGAGGELAFQDVVKQVGQQYSSDQFKDISVPFCFICVLHLANEKGLSLEAKGMADLVVRKSV